MKRKNFFKWISPVICITFLGALGSYIVDTNNRNNSFGNVLSLDLNSNVKEKINDNSFQMNQSDSIEQEKQIFDGSVLNKAAVVALGWDQKSHITLADWEAQAPNVIQLSTSDGVNENGPFSNNSILQWIQIPDSVLSINNFSFYNCQSLTEIIFGPNSRLSNIGSGSFFQSGVRTLIIPKVVSQIGNSAFENSKLTSISFQSGSNLEAIGNNAFKNSLIQLIEIPGSLKTINESAFKNTKALKTIKFDENSSQLTNIGLEAFLGSSITYIDIPKSVLSVGENAFQNTTSLENIKLFYKLFLSSGKNSLEPLFGLTNEQWFSINWLDIPTSDVKINAIIARSLLKINNEIEWREISIYSGIEELAFKDTPIRSITIEWKEDFTIGDNAFQNTVNLNSIRISSKYEKNIGRYGFTSNQTKIIQLINDNFFESSSFITVITMSISGLVLILAIIVGIIISSKHHKRKEIIIDELRQKYEEYEEVEYEENEEMIE